MRNTDIKQLIQQIKESKSFQEFVENDEELKEMNVTGNVAGYNTPAAFASSEESHEAKVKDSLDSYGYSIANKPKKTNMVKSESSVYKEAMASLHEVSYREFKTDPSRPNGRKINDAIKGIDGALREIERAVKHASRLKSEANVDQRSLWKSSVSRIVRIHERLVRITKKINELGA